MTLNCRNCGFELEAHRDLPGGVLLCAPIAQGSRSFVPGPTYEMLAQRVAALEAALVPFADYADTWPATDEPWPIDGIRYTDAYEFGYRFRQGGGLPVMMLLGHYREARRLLGRAPARGEYEGGPEEP